MDINKPSNPKELRIRFFPYFYFEYKSNEICFFHEVTESSCGGDDVKETPIAFGIRRPLLDGIIPPFALFVRHGPKTSFVGVFSTSNEALDFLNSEYEIEFFQSEFVTLSTETVDN